MSSEGFEVRDVDVEVSELEETSAPISHETPVVQADSGDDPEGDVMLLAEATDPDLVLPVWEATGNVEVDQALEMIQLLDSKDVHQHPEVLGEVHSQLHGLMSQLDR